jgi:predicted AAA+ superfamily ATPase
VHALFPDAATYDLLLSSEYRRLIADPGLVRHECEARRLTGRTQASPIIIDEVQKVPDLLDEVHWLIENRGLRFVLCGSSARKLKRSHANLLGGRGLRFSLMPLVSEEIPQFSLQRALNRGLLPPHYDSEDAAQLLEAYVGKYLREEIAAEALTRNIPAFGRFLEVAALANGEIVNYANIARDCGVSALTVRTYFEILEDTLVGRFVRPASRRGRRRIVETPKFYLFDVGVAAVLSKRGPVQPGSELFGRAFEHFLFMEIAAHAEYLGGRYPVEYWRTTSGFEVDFVLAGGKVAVEPKATRHAHAGHVRGLSAHREECRPERSILVTLEPRPRLLGDGVETMPWQHFLRHLWAGQIAP